MSDTTQAKGKKDGAEGGLSEADTTFLVTCLQHTTGGSISIDTEAVAAILSYSNHRSVGNKIGVLKKRLNLPIGTSKATAEGGSSPAVPKTPSSDRVSKAKSTPRKKATPKKAASGDEGEAAEEGATTPTAPAKRGRAKKVKKEPVKEESAEEDDQYEVQEPQEGEVEAKVEEDEYEDVDAA